MPDRIVRMGILTSDAVNQLSPEGEVFYRRLMNVADDYGRYDGRPSVLLAALYPLKLDRVTLTNISGWLDEAIRAGLVCAYSVENKPFVEVLKFGQRIRSDSKWPSPVRQSSAGRSARTKTPNVPNTTTHTHTPTPTTTDSGGFGLFWTAYPRKVKKVAAHAAWKRLHPTPTLTQTLLTALDQHKRSAQWTKDNGQFIPYPATWLNGHQWEDELLSDKDRARIELQEAMKRDGH